MTDTLTADEQARFDSLYGATPTAAEPDGPGIFAGAYKGLAGIPSGLAGAPLSVASAFTSAPDVAHSPILGSAYTTDFDLSSDQLAELEKSSKDYFSTSFQGAIHQPIEDLRQSAADLYRPDPQTTGFVGNTLFGVTDVLTRVGVGNLIAPGSGLALAAGTTGFERTQDLEAQGVDATTAQASGALTGVSLLAMGGVANAFGKTLAMRAITGAGSNVAFGAGTRGLDSALLNAHGYTAQAEQQKWNDGAAIAADLVIGAGFGLLPHGNPAEKLPADVVDSALTAKSAQQASDLAPGAPADARSASQHIDALDTAQAQLMDGQPVDVDPIVREATFVPREDVPTDTSVHDALTEAGVPAERLGAEGAVRPAETPNLPGIEPAPYEARLTELRDRRRQGIELTPVEQGELLDLQDQDARQAKVAGQPIAGVQNMAGRAETERAGNLLPVQVFADADNFKGLNDNLGHETGDVVIRQIGALMARELGDGNVFHRGGDEFVAQGRTEADVVAAMDRVRERLANMDLKATFEDGSEARQTGVGLSYGHGPDVKAAEQAQYADKQRRKDAGLRTDRSESDRRSADRGRDGAPVDRRGQTSSETRTGQPERVASRGIAEAPLAGTDAARAGAEPAQQGTPAADGAGQSRTGLDPARAGEVDRARQAVEANPDADVGDGTTVADAMRAADEEVHQAETQGEAIRAAIACFLRFGAEA